jgi:hypothetical protein
MLNPRIQRALKPTKYQSIIYTFRSSDSIEGHFYQEGPLRSYLLMNYAHHNKDARIKSTVHELIVRQPNIHNRWDTEKQQVFRHHLVNRRTFIINVVGTIIHRVLTCSCQGEINRGFPPGADHFFGLYVLDCYLLHNQR